MQCGEGGGEMGPHNGSRCWGGPDICTVASVTHKLMPIESGRLFCQKGSNIQTHKSWTDSCSLIILALPFSFSSNPVRGDNCPDACHCCRGQAQTDLLQWQQASSLLSLQLPQFSVPGIWLTTLQLRSHFCAMTAAVQEYFYVHLFSRPEHRFPLPQNSQFTVPFLFGFNTMPSQLTLRATNKYRLLGSLIWKYNMGLHLSNGIQFEYV